MIVRTLEDARGSERRVATSNWESVRLLLNADKMGFSFHITTIYAGSETPIWYKNHLEAVYCIAGEGEIEVMAAATQESRTYVIRPGTLYALYALDEHDRHKLRAGSELTLACVFNPALHGQEVHDAGGTYPLELETAGG
jgi:L-ectoine synthase